MSRTDENVQRISEVPKSDRRLTMRRMVENKIGIDKMIIHGIITEKLAMRMICVKHVPNVLTADQKQRLVSDDKQHRNDCPNPLQSQLGTSR